MVQEQPEQERERENGGHVKDVAPHDPVREAAAKQATALRGEGAPEVRIERLFSAMGAQRDVLRGILRACEERPVPDAQMEDVVRALQKNNVSVYSGATLCAVLAEAGALERVDEDGRPIDGAAAEPDLVEEGGATYLTPHKGPSGFWRTTSAGAAYADAYDPDAEMRAMLDEDALHLPIYKRILQECAKEGGAGAHALGDAVDDHPLMQQPKRMLSAHFVDRLQECGALEWKGAWMTTKTGLSALEGPLAQVAAAVTEGKEQA